MKFSILVALAASVNAVAVEQRQHKVDITARQSLVHLSYARSLLQLTDISIQAQESGHHCEER